MSAVETQQYLVRARDFLKGVDLLKDDPAYGYSVALLAIHGVISYTDALRVGLGDNRLAATDHKDAANSLKSLLTRRKYLKQDGVARFQHLIAKKNAIAYLAPSVDREEIKSIIQQAERFTIWAELAGTELKIERWLT